MDMDGVKWDGVVHFQNGRYEVGECTRVICRTLSTKERETTSCWVSIFSKC